MPILKYLIGPRIPLDELELHRGRYAAPTIVLSIARICLMCSLLLPYWHIKLKAPQYPKRDLQLNAYINRIEGDLREINGLNHYIGMRPLQEAASIEKAIGVWGIIAMVLMVEVSMFVHSRWAVLMMLPAILFPLLFLGDLAWWLHEFGQNLDPKAPLSTSVKPFTPPALGEGSIGQFKTIAWMGWGLWLAWAASLLSILALFLHRRAYRPLYVKMREKWNHARTSVAATSTR
ncbi:MAG TPA: hypothetical protein PK402_00110 [Tepidisphaeraceae bacterium]|nr:hypothetical protein [Tepidisphaeraceae bacterium]